MLKEVEEQSANLLIVGEELDVEASATAIIEQ
jgi:hypothetical protein